MTLIDKIMHSFFFTFDWIFFFNWCIYSPLSLNGTKVLKKKYAFNHPHVHLLVPNIMIPIHAIGPHIKQTNHILKSSIELTKFNNILKVPYLGLVK